jgi:D-alanine-D-alanine ligase
VDLVFNIAEGHGSRSREAHVPAACEMLGLPCAHSDPLTLALPLDRPLTKRVVASHGVPTAAFCLVERVEELEHAPLPPYPLTAKLNGEGSSIGIRRRARCYTRSELMERVGRLLAEYGQQVIIEQFLPDVEATVAILGTGTGARVAGIMEIAPRRTPQTEFIYSLETKRNYAQEVTYYVPPRLSAPTLDAYRALGCRDVGRVDLRLDADGSPRFLEINPLPDLHPADGDLTICCGLAGMPYAAVITSIVESARSRNALGRPGRRLRAS